MQRSYFLDPTLGAQSLNHWTAREVPYPLSKRRIPIASYRCDVGLWVGSSGSRQSLTDLFISDKYSVSYSVTSDSVIIAHQAPLSMGFSRQEYWSGQPRHTSKDPLLLAFSCLGLTGSLPLQPLLLLSRPLLQGEVPYLLPTGFYLPELP